MAYPNRTCGELIFPLLSCWGQTSPRQTSAPNMYMIKAGNSTFPQERVLTCFAPRPSWTTHFGRREKKQGGEEQGKIKSPTEHYYLLHVLDPLQHKNSWHRSALSQHRENNHHSVSSQETRSRITLLILPYSSSVALSNSETPTPGFSLWCTAYLCTS